MPGPAELGLHQDGVDTGEVCTGKDLGVGNLFLPLDAENPPEAGGVEVVQLPCMPLVDCPCFAALEKGGEDCISVYLGLDFGCDASPISDLFVESAKSSTCFSKSGVELIVHDDGSRDGTAEVGELVHHIQCLSIDGDGGLYVWVCQCWLVHDFSLLSADHPAQVVANEVA